MRSKAEPPTPHLLRRAAQMSEPLTQLEKRVYHYMIDFLAENTYQPSIREIAKKFRLEDFKRGDEKTIHTDYEAAAREGAGDER